MMPDLDACIFDFDGTLVDTMPVHFEAYRRTFAEAGIELTPADFYPNIGGTARETIPKFLRGRTCAWSVEALHARKKELVVSLFTVQPIRELACARLLPVLAGRVRMAIASSGSRVGIDLALERLGWRRYFDTVVTGEDVARGKPEPDLFLLAASRIQVPPSRCIVFEDTEDGVAAARAAGMTVFDVRDASAESRS